MLKRKAGTLPFAETKLKEHFRDHSLQELSTSSRIFPITARVDVQFALEKVFSNRSDVQLLGLHQNYGHETMTIAHLIANQHDPAVIGPLQHEEVDIGETMPARCLRKAMWLSLREGVPFALLLTSAHQYGQPGGVHLEIAVAPGDDGASLSRSLFEDYREIRYASSRLEGEL